MVALGQRRDLAVDPVHLGGAPAFEVVGEDEEVDVTKLYSSWRDWCDDQGRTHPGTKAVFGRDLHASVPGLSIHKRPRKYRGIGLNDSIHGIESPDEGGWGEV